MKHLEIRFLQRIYVSPIRVDEEDYYLKTNELPAGFMVYKLVPKSYRDLLTNRRIGTVYRFEKSGEFHGLQRVRGFTQNDAHLFCYPDQLEDTLMSHWIC